ncbi:hypothetical protein [Chitinophaga cymbidii]|uniref:Uncharacterized protein n=1 Tax=Chitinophaga cymbidii TaxID=1096750 RepID=A0A512RIL1_9BACT|nr:hypothetical protein [Chitinophaga cymbidii]GEP95541.1 hypothetical protein CCY01nite_18010 [Chitinophaga cymbidii]
MKGDQIDKLETKVLALRKIADDMLEEVRQARASVPAGKRKKQLIDREADLIARLASGRYKPAAAKNKP